MLKSWEAATSRAKRKSGIAPEELFLLGSPSAYRLARLGLPWKGDSELFSYWGTYHVKEVQKRKFLVVERNGKPKVLSVIRHYRLSSYGSGRGKGEENAMTLLHENPSKTNTVPPQGCPVGGSSAGWPKLLDEEGVRTFAGNCQSRMTPIGKKGLCALHSHYQFCTPHEISGGIFQRYLTGPTPEGSIRRAALTLRKLAEADPKTTPDGEKGLLKRVCEDLKSTVECVMEDFATARGATEAETLYSGAHVVEESLPNIWVGQLMVSISPERAYGPNPKTWAVSISTGGAKSTAEENRNAFMDAWRELTD